MCVTSSIAGALIVSMLMEEEEEEEERKREEEEKEKEKKFRSIKYSTINSITAGYTNNVYLRSRPIKKRNK